MSARQLKRVERDPLCLTPYHASTARGISAPTKSISVALGGTGHRKLSIVERKLIKITLDLNARFDQPVLVHAAQQAWVDSPSPGVQRRMLDRVGAELARATSIVRYASGSRFAPHQHGGGEEFLVLDGVFEDDDGDYPAGCYVRNPPQTRHTPCSVRGCTLFVKLWQFDAADQVRLRIDTADDRLFGATAGAAARRRMPLFSNAREVVLIEQWPGGLRDRLIAPAGGLELLVLRGGFQIEALAGVAPVFAAQPFAEQSWCRLPAGVELPIESAAQGCRLWIKTGHLQHVQSDLARLAAQAASPASSG